MGGSSSNDGGAGGSTSSSQAGMTGSERTADSEANASRDRPDDNDRGGAREAKETFDRAMDNANRPDRAPTSSPETTTVADNGDDDKPESPDLSNDDRPDRAAGPPGIGAPPSSPSPTDTAKNTDDNNDQEERSFLDRVADTLTAAPTDAEGNARSTSPVADRINNTKTYSLDDLRNVFTLDDVLTSEQSQALANGAAVMDGVAVLPSLKEQVQLYQADLRLQQRGLEYQKSVLAQKPNPLSSDTMEVAEIDRQLQGITTRRDALDQISRPDLSTGLTPEILHFDPKADGQVVVAYGDIKNATHIGVMVPGMTTDLNSFPSTNLRAQRLMQALSDEPGVTPAVIGYLGYDAPDGLLEAISADQAVEGAPTFADFLNTLPEDADTHVLAHSYGSLLTGKALADGARPDFAHIFGSPGIGVDSIEELNLNGRTIVTSTENPGDQVSFSERFGEVPPNNAINYPPMGEGHFEYFDPAMLTEIMMGRRQPQENGQ